MLAHPHGVDHQGFPADSRDGHNLEKVGSPIRPQVEGLVGVQLADDQSVIDGMADVFVAVLCLRAECRISTRSNRNTEIVGRERR